MSNEIFPALPGLDWNVKRMPTFATMAQAASNGRMSRQPRFVDPMWQFELSFEFLRDDPAHDELNQLLGFFLARRGSYDSFLLDLSTLTQNPNDAAVTGQLLTVDANNCAPLVRTAQGLTETIYELAGIPRVYANGTLLQPGIDYILCNDNPVLSGVTASQQSSWLMSDAALDCVANGSNFDIHFYGRPGGVPTSGAPVTYMLPDGSSFTNAYAGFGGKAAGTYYLFGPANNYETVLATARARVAAGEVCVGVVTTPGTIFSGGMYVPQSGYSGYYLKFRTTPAAPVTADFGWLYRVIFSGGRGSAGDPQLGNDQLEFSALWYQMYECQQITLVSARE